MHPLTLLAQIMCRVTLNMVCIVSLGKNLHTFPQVSNIIVKGLYTNQHFHSLLERARCILSNVWLCHRLDFWAEAISTICYLVNRSPYSSINIKIPEEVWSSPMNFSNVKVLGYPAFAHVNDRKLAPTVVKCLFLGYASESKGYRLLCQIWEKLFWVETLLLKKMHCCVLKKSILYYLMV